MCLTKAIFQQLTVKHKQVLGPNFPVPEVGKILFEMKEVAAASACEELRSVKEI